MTATEKLTAFLHGYHDDVMGCEKRALEALKRGDKDSYLRDMKSKAEKMADLLGKAMPYLAELPEDDKTAVFHALHRFSNSANMGLHVNSPFYWAALLWNDDAKEGDPDNFQIFINTLETGGPAAVKEM